MNRRLLLFALLFLFFFPSCVKKGAVTPFVAIPDTKVAATPVQLKTYSTADTIPGVDTFYGYISVYSNLYNNFYGTCDFYVFHFAKGDSINIYYNTISNYILPGSSFIFKVDSSNAYSLLGIGDNYFFSFSNDSLYYYWYDNMEDDASFSGKRIKHTDTNTR